VTGIAHARKVPAITWAELLELEPGLGDVDELVDLLSEPEGWDWGRRYVAVKHYACLLVGWGRGGQAPDVIHYEDDGHDGGLRVQNLADIFADYEHLTPEPLTEAERWLRTPAAYDLAMNHLIERLEARGMA
jgi:hypothetical protein